MNPIAVDAPRTVLTTPPTPTHQHHTDILIVGGGVTGLMAALRASRSSNVILLTNSSPLESNSAWAQGGIAAALDAADSPTLHIEDTLTAGAGLSDRTAVEALAWEAPLLMYALAKLGMPFERENGDFVLGLEGSHSHRRILHVGDMTGLALTNTLVHQVRSSPHITILAGYQAIELLCHTADCTGVLALDDDGNLHHFAATATILATGGAGALYGLTSNQPGALGEGIALAYRAGAEVVDMEFIQFHPTVFQTSDGQGFLISEATRGEGGKLYGSPSGERFMPALHPRAELAPRDVVTRGIFDAMQREGSPHVLLDLTHMSEGYMQRRFPTIYARCCKEGINPAREPIPVAPAAHYLMGGIRTNLYGATTLPGLYAAGECACTGVHGANRLASNSLLECLVSGSRAAAAALVYCENQPHDHTTNHSEWVATSIPYATRRGDGATVPSRATLADTMRTCAGPLRSAEGLSEGMQRLACFPRQACTTSPETITLANAALVAELIIAGGMMREESRGAHYRRDFPATNDSQWRNHLVMRRGNAAYAVQTVADLNPIAPKRETPGYAELEAHATGEYCLLAADAIG
jgi:L-aspartate oxidase